MKEFIEKLIGRLEERLFFCECSDENVITVSNVKKIVNELAEEYKPNVNPDIQEVIDKLEVYTVGRLKNARVHITVEELQNQIDRLEQLAEEHNNDFCEWKKIFDDDVDSQYKTSCSEDGIVDMTGYFDYEFCPYCGKRIKVVE